MALSDMFRLLSPLSVEREINGTPVTFYTCSLRVCARLSGMISEISGHVITLLGNNSSRDQGKVEEDWQDTDGVMASKITTQPINPELAKIRAEHRERAVQGALDALMSDKNRAAIGDLLMDSLKDNFPRGTKRPTPECLDFVDQMDVPTFIEFCKGVMEANSKVFGDLGKGFGRAVQDKAEQLLGQATVEKSLEAQPTDG